MVRRLSVQGRADRPDRHELCVPSHPDASRARARRLAGKAEAHELPTHREIRVDLPVRAVDLIAEPDGAGRADRADVQGDLGARKQIRQESGELLAGSDAGFAVLRGGGGIGRSEPAEAEVPRTRTAASPVSITC